MKTKRFRLTKAAKILIVAVVAIVATVGIYLGVSSGKIKTNESLLKSIVGDSEDAVITADKTGSSKTINLSLDEWIGYKSIIDANGGLTTQKGSIFDNLGIKVNINVINDATQSSNALVSGGLNAAGYTVNRLAFLSNKFQNANFDVIMPFITNYSNGGDGIIAKTNIKSVNDLVNAKIGVPEFSESQTLVIWFVNQSDLSESDKKKIIDNLILFETPDEAAKAFFSGKVDVAATWQPYLSQAESATDSHILFSTANSTKLIQSGVVFSKKWAEDNQDVVAAFIDGVLQAKSLYATDFSTIKKVMPMFSGMTDEEIIENTENAKLATWFNNESLLASNGDVINTYNDMCDIWEQIGETTNRNLAKTAFDTKYLDKLADKYKTNTDSSKLENDKAVTVVNDNNKEEVINTAALLSKSVTINFSANTAKFLDSSTASAALDEFVKIARTLDGAIIQIEGNTDNDATDAVTEQANVALSEQRANTVKQYLIVNGISADRIVTIGNGGSKPVAPRDTEENMAKNRRTDISFKMLEK